MIRNSGFFTLFLLATMPLLTMALPAVEGRIAPVVGPAKVTAVLHEDGGWTYFSMEGTKLRDCRWVRTQWFFGQRDGNHVPVPFEHLGRPVLRETGAQVWTRSRIQASPSDLREHSFADVVHVCPGWWRWWTVRTPLYP